MRGVEAEHLKFAVDRVKTRRERKKKEMFKLLAYAVVVLLFGFLIMFYAVRLAVPSLSSPGQLALILAGTELAAAGGCVIAIMAGILRRARGGNTSISLHTMQEPS
jgi:protein-S-isoprenylcysteine O-methyltransferase Ste14